MTQQSLMFDRDLADLNQGFLRLVAQGAEAGLSAGVCHRLQTLRRTPRRRLAAVPYALFSFGFEEAAAWDRLLSPGVRDLEPDYSNRNAAAERFTLLALAALRSYLHTAPHSVSAWIGLPLELRVRLLALDLGALPPLAQLAAPRLRGRLAGEETFWFRLIDAATRGDERQLGLLAALGKQWTIRRCLGLEALNTSARGFRRG